MGSSLSDSKLDLKSFFILRSDDCTNRKIANYVKKKEEIMSKTLDSPGMDNRLSRAVRHFPTPYQIQSRIENIVGKKVRGSG